MLELENDNLTQSTAHNFRRLYIAALMLPSMTTAEFKDYAEPNSSFRDQLMISAHTEHAVFGRVSTHIHFPRFKFL